MVASAEPGELLEGTKTSSGGRTQHLVGFRAVKLPLGSLSSVQHWPGARQWAVASPVAQVGYLSGSYVRSFSSSRRWPRWSEDN